MTIIDGEKWHYLSVKSLLRLLHGNTFKHKDDHYCKNFFHAFRKDYKLENVYKNHNFCNIKIPEGRDKILKFTQNHKSMKIPFFIYADSESLLEREKHAMVI